MMEEQIKNVKKYWIRNQIDFLEKIIRYINRDSAITKCEIEYKIKELKKELNQEGQDNAE